MEPMWTVEYCELQHLAFEKVVLDEQIWFTIRRCRNSAILEAHVSRSLVETGKTYRKQFNTVDEARAEADHLFPIVNFLEKGWE